MCVGEGPGVGGGGGGGTLLPRFWAKSADFFWLAQLAGRVLLVSGV